MSGTPGPDAPPGPNPFRTDRPRPERPVLLTSLTGAALLNGADELSLRRETRGAVLDWGGLYGEGVRLTGPWSVRLEAGEEAFTIGRATLASMEQDAGGLRATHRAGPYRLTDSLSPLEGEPGFLRRFELDAGAAGDPLRLRASFAPYLMPVLIEGVRPVDYRWEIDAASATVRSHGFALWAGPDPSPPHPGTDAAPAELSRGSDGELVATWQLSSDRTSGSTMGLAILGGLSASLDRRRGRTGALSVGRANALARWSSWVGRTPSLSFPDAPKLDAAYAAARGALWSLYSAPAEGLEGLVAGYPWYSALWCRDLAWMLPAVAWLGDHAWAARSVENVFRFQALADLPILGGRRGELPMQLSAGPIFLYGTSDTSLYYPGLVRRLRDHSGSTDLGERLAAPIRRILDWAAVRCDRSTGLVRNGGEVETMSQEAVSGHVRVGFDAVDTTIWDSTDRRDHAIDVQLLWADALSAATSLPPPAAQGDGLAGLPAAESIRRRVAGAYWWEKEGYLYDSLRSDGTPIERMRPNALRAVTDGLLSPDRALRAVRRIGESDMTTAWGVRTLSSLDPSYSPTAYHDGQVWTIATAWAAEAALQVGEVELGLRYLESIAERLRLEEGFANECYRGDRPEAYDSCFLLGFSVAPFLSALFGSLWGIRPELGERRVSVAPRFPSGWGSASLERLALAEGALDLSWTPERLAVRWSGRDPLRVSSGAEDVWVGPGGAATLALDGSR